MCKTSCKPNCTKPIQESVPNICILESTVHDGRTTKGGHSITMGDDDALAGKSEEKRPFGKEQMGG
jgi:hypothetical protein